MANKTNQKISTKKQGRSLKEKRAAKKAKNGRKSKLLSSGDGVPRAAGLRR